MENSRIDAVGLLLAAGAATLVFFAVQMNFGYLTSLAGLTLLLVVLAYDRQGYRSGLQSLAFAMVCGACLTLAAGYVLHIISSPTDPKLDHAVFEEWLSIAWLVGTGIFWGVDRARMGARGQAVPEFTPPVARSTGQGFIAQSVPVTAYVPPPVPAPAPAYVPPAPAYVPPPPPPPPAYVPPPQPVYRQPEPVVPAYVPPAPLIEPIDSPVPVPPPAYVPPPVPPPPPPPAAKPPVHQIAPGREATIYVNLLGETMSMLRAVRAESVGRDFYLIADEMPENETWEFKPGQIVRCKKKNLSSGKALVAFEEAPRP